ncbi:MAG: hypothetical protein ABEJ34_08445 [Haloferacaceae archaeon]
MNDDADDTADADGGADEDATDATDGDEAFATELERARDLVGADDLTAFHVGVVRGGEEVETTFSYRTDGVDAEREGVQALTLLATHLRIVADEAGVDRETVAADAAALAGRVEETDGTVTD